jgi:Dolichyl-phosphate-mannose-protein mannosyltransferase
MSDGGERSPEPAGASRRASRLITGSFALPVWLLAVLLLLAYGMTFGFHSAALPDEFIYLAGARRFAQSGSLNACFYMYEAILSHGYPLKDDHAPGYVILLGSFFRLFPAGYWGAVALNVLAYLAGAWLVGELSRELGGTRPWIASALFLVLPTTLAYVYWIMAEVVLVTLFLLALWVAARHASRPLGAMAAGVLLGVTFLVRESALFGLPAMLALAPGKRRAALMLAGFLAFTLLVYVPLSIDRAPGGANFWAPTSGKAFGYQIVESAQEGRFWAAANGFVERAAANWSELLVTRRTEQGFLLLFTLLPLWSLATLGGRSSREKRFYVALSAGFVAMVLLQFGVYVIARWSGFRYLMILMPPFLPAFDVSIPGRGRAAIRWVPAAVTFIGGLTLIPPTHRILDPFKATSSGVAAQLEYIRRYTGPELPRVVLYRRGYCFGLAERPIDVIFTVPGDLKELRRLERAVWFDIAVVGDAAQLESRPGHLQRYRLLNGDDPDPPFSIYARLKRDR